MAVPKARRSKRARRARHQRTEVEKTIFQKAAAATLVAAGIYLFSSGIATGIARVGTKPLQLAELLGEKTTSDRFDEGIKSLNVGGTPQMANEEQGGYLSIGASDPALNTLVVWAGYNRAPTETQKRDPIYLFLHGNSMLVGEGEQVLKRSFNNSPILLVTYYGFPGTYEPGEGGSWSTADFLGPGTPDTAHLSVLAALKYAIETCGCRHVVVLGYSIGTAMAISATSEYLENLKRRGDISDTRLVEFRSSIRNVVMLAPFTSLYAAVHPKASLLLWDRFIAKPFLHQLAPCTAGENFRCAFDGIPCLVIYNRADRIVNPEASKKLLADMEAEKIKVVGIPIVRSGEGSHYLDTLLDTVFDISNVSVSPATDAQSVIGDLNRGLEQNTTGRSGLTVSQGIKILTGVHQTKSTK